MNVAGKPGCYCLSLFSSSAQIDDLTYNYEDKSNRLLNISDAYNDAQTSLGDFRVSAQNPTQTKTTTTVDYTYDENGNLTKDFNKDLVTSAGGNGITYSHLNTPDYITVKRDASSNKGIISFIYDAFGTKLKKVTTENPHASNNNKTITTTTTYIGEFVYESRTISPADPLRPDYTDRLLFISHEEGRIRFKPENNSFEYDYMIKDHLGNVRMVLTEEVQTIYYPAATMEGTYTANGVTPQANSMVNTEKQYYNVDASKITAETSIPSWGTETVANTKLYYNNNGNPPANTNYPIGCVPVQTDGSAKLYKLNATTNRTGLEFMMKVMAGDKIDIFGKSYYLNTTTITNANSTALDLLALMSSLLVGPSSAAASKGLTATQLNTLNTGLVPTTFFRGTNGEATTTVPKAYINYILFDEQFKYVAGNFSRVGTSGSVKSHWNVDAQLQNISVNKNGYLFVYVSNESNFDVFFDNLQVIHKPGAIVEETHYYPFGLTMAGISSRALINAPENKFRYNKGSELQNKEFSDGSGLELYSTAFRVLDPQLGRWWQIDPKPDYAQSLYSAMGNNPITYTDFLGDTLQGVDNQDSRRMKKVIRGSFQGEGTQALKKLFKRDGNTFRSIDEKAFLKATKGLSEAQKALAKGYKDAINSKTETHVVDVVKRKENLSMKASIAFADLKAADFDKRMGGGGNKATSTGSISVVVLDSKDRGEYMTSDLFSTVERPSSVGERMAHEVVGHALGRVNNVDDADAAIQVTNVYLRANGIRNVFRDGGQHSNENGRMLPDQAQQIPSYLKSSE